MKLFEISTLQKRSTRISSMDLRIVNTQLSQSTFIPDPTPQQMLAQIRSSLKNQD